MILKGYIFSRPFFGERVPQHVQNIVLRDYCQKRNHSFLMSNTEYSVPKSSYILMDLIDHMKQIDGIILYSIFQLPEDFKLRKKIYNQIYKEKKSLHFAVENRAVTKKNDFNFIEKIYSLKKVEFNKEKYLIKKISNGKKRNFVSKKHYKVKRDYLHRMINEKIKCMKVAKKYEFDYWDGDRKYGYGGYKFIEGYHREVAIKFIKNYKLTNNSSVLDLGCGKGFLMYEIKKILKNIKITGLDISKYAKKYAKKEIKKNILTKNIKKKLSYPDKTFDLVISINTLHNLKLNDLETSLKEIERVGKSKYICIESYRNEKEQFNLQCWALTAETLIDINSWKWMFNKAKYSGDYEFIFFK